MQLSTGSYWYRNPIFMRRFGPSSSMFGLFQDKSLIKFTYIYVLVVNVILLSILYFLLFDPHALLFIMIYHVFEFNGSGILRNNFIPYFVMLKLLIQLSRCPVFSHTTRWSHKMFVLVRFNSISTQLQGFFSSSVMPQKRNNAVSAFHITYNPGRRAYNFFLLPWKIFLKKFADDQFNDYI